MQDGLSLIEKDSIATTWDSFKDCILARKIWNQRFHRQSVLALRRSGCSVRKMFCTIFVPLSVAKVPKKHVQSSSYLVLVFFKENLHIRWKFSEQFFYYNYFTPNFSNQYFSELLFLVGDRKIRKIYQRKLKSGDRLWRSKLLIGSYVFKENYFL